MSKSKKAPKKAARPRIDKHLASKILDVVDKGLSSGLGIRKPGQMCVEAAVCYAMGLPHGDDPKCVGKAVRDTKIALNDFEAWKSPQVRARALRKLSIAQLGSDKIDQDKFVKLTWLNLRSDVMRPLERLISRTCPSPSKTPSNVAAWLLRLKEVETFVDEEGIDDCLLVGWLENADYVLTLLKKNDKVSRELQLSYAKRMCKAALDALIELKSPGCKYLDLCE